MIGVLNCGVFWVDVPSHLGSGLRRNAVSVGSMPPNGPHLSR